MNKPVKLSEVIEALEMRDMDMYYETKVFFNKITGEIIVLQEEEYTAAEEDEDLTNFPEWQRDVIKKAKDIIENEDNYIPLPSKFDINDYEIMQDFCLSVDDLNMSEELYYGIKGSGAFRRFREMIRRFGIEDDWYKYRDEALKQIAIHWCNENGIVFEEGEGEA